MDRNGACLRLAALAIVAASLAAPCRAHDDLTPEEVLDLTGRALASIARRAIPCVVHVWADNRPPSPDAEKEEGLTPEMQERMRQLWMHPDLRRLHGPFPFRRRREGTGLIVSEDGYIVSNHHVVGDADSIKVRLHDGREFDATVVGTDAKSEIAVIKIAAEKLPVLPDGDSKELDVGEWVMAIGNPFGLSETVTVGVVSAKGRSGLAIAEYEDFIQTDAAINPGNSGGPLIDKQGKVIGICTAIVSGTGSYMGVGLAVPMSMARGVIDQLIQSGHVTRGFLGVYIQNVNHEMAEFFGLKTAGGIIIAEVLKGSAADRAGLNADDIVLELDGLAVRNTSAFRNAVAARQPGTPISLLVFREGQKRKVAVTAGEHPDQVAAEAPASGPDIDGLGLSVEALPKELAAEMDMDAGVIVTGVAEGSLSSAQGLEVGNVIASVNRKRVKDPQEFARLVEEASGRGKVLLLVKTGNSTRYVLITRSPVTAP
jgi:serine protease Do